MKLSVVVAYYNEEAMIQKTHAEIATVLQSIEGIEYEMVYVNDGSNDKTLALMKAIAQTDDHVTYISFSRNFGRESAILAGLKYATGDAVLLMDGDLQHPPALIPDFLQAYQEGYEVVSGRRNREGESKRSTFFANLFYRFSTRLMDVKLTDGIAEFKLLSRRVVDTIVALPEYNRFSKGIFAWVGFKEKVIPYQNQIREAGDSKFGFVRSLNYAFQGIISFNDKPLRICVKFGLGCVSLAFLYAVWLIISWFITPEKFVSGYLTTIFAVILFSGVQLISVGILGEYIGKIYYEVKRRPHFIVEETNSKEIKEKIG